MWFLRALVESVLFWGTIWFIVVVAWSVYEKAAEIYRCLRTAMPTWVLHGSLRGAS